MTYMLFGSVLLFSVPGLVFVGVFAQLTDAPLPRVIEWHFLWFSTLNNHLGFFTLLLTVRGGNFWDMFKISSWRTTSSQTESMVGSSATVTITTTTDST